MTAEISHLNHSCRPRLQPLQFPQRLIECQQIDAASFNPHAYRIQVFPNLAGSALLRVIPAGKVHQDAAHLLAGDGEEMCPALYFARFAAGQPQVSLMNQGRSLKDVIWPLVLHLARRNPVKFRIDQFGGLFGGPLVPPLHSVQQQSELRRGACRRLLLLALNHLATVYSHAKGKGIPAERKASATFFYRPCGPMPISAGILRYPICEPKKSVDGFQAAGTLVSNGDWWYMVINVAVDARPSTVVVHLGFAKKRQRNINLMKMMLIVVTLFAETLGTSLFAADKNRASNSAIEQQLTAMYRLTTVNRGGEIVAAGSVLVLQKNGLLVYSISNPLAPQSTYTNGKITRNSLGGKSFGRDLLNVMNIPGGSVDIDQRTLVAGTRLWVTKIAIQKDGVDFRLYTDPEGGGLYFGELKVPFAKNSVPPADALSIMIAEVLAVQPDDVVAPPPPPSEQIVQQPAQPVEPVESAQPVAPVTIKMGDSTDQVVTSVGQPDRIAKVANKEIYFYKDMKITFVDGKVSDIQ